MDKRYLNLTVFSIQKRTNNSASILHIKNKSDGTNEQNNSELAIINHYRVF